MLELSGLTSRSPTGKNMAKKLHFSLDGPPEQLHVVASTLKILATLFLSATLSSINCLMKLPAILVILVFVKRSFQLTNKAQQLTIILIHKQQSFPQKTCFNRIYLVVLSLQTLPSSRRAACERPRQTAYEANIRSRERKKERGGRERENVGVTPRPDQRRERERK